METFEISLKKYADFVRSELRPMIDHNISEAEKEVLALSNALGGECGELQNVIKKIISKDLFFKPSNYHEQLIKEAGDVFWYLFRLLYKAGYNVENVLQQNINKLTERYKEGDTWRK